MVASYLQHAQIGVILGDTLFVHGAVEERALGFIPSPLTRYKLNSTSAWREPKCLDWLVVSRIFWNFHPDKLGKGFNLTSIFFHIFSYGLVQPPTSLDWNFFFFLGWPLWKEAVVSKVVHFFSQQLITVEETIPSCWNLEDEHFVFCAGLMAMCQFSGHSLRDFEADP